MTGWKTTKEILDLRDDVIAKLNAVDPEVRRNAWYWISFDVEVFDELEGKDSTSGMTDEDLEWLRAHPARFAQHKAVRQRTVESLRARLANAEAFLARLGDK